MLLFYSMYIVPLSVLIPIFFGIKFYKVLARPYKIIFWFAVFSGIVNYVNIHLMIQFLKQNSIGLVNFYTIFEFLFLAAFYREFQNKTGKAFTATLMVAFTILCIVNYLFIQKNNAFNTYTRTASGVIIVAFAIQFLFRQGDAEHDRRWGDDGLNWLNAGILFYYSCGIFLFMLFNYLITVTPFINGVLWAMLNTILILEYILYAVGFYKCKTHPKTY